MNKNVNIFLNEIQNQTRDYILQYISQKNRGIENQVYLSFYFDQVNDERPFKRQSQLNKRLKEIELTLKLQLSPLSANKILTNLKKLNLADVIKISNQSLAIFCTENFSGFVILPHNVHENVIIAKSLHLKPLINWISKKDQFYLITLSSKQCRLLKGDTFSIEVLANIDLLQQETEKEKTMDEKVQRNKLINYALSGFNKIINKNQIPIILGGVSELHDLCSKTYQDKEIVSKKIIGNLDRSSYEELHQECIKILSEKNHFKTTEVINLISESLPYGKAIEDVNEITLAAIQGRVRNLLIAQDKTLFGSLDKTTGSISLHINKKSKIPEDDILDDLAEIVMARGGLVSLANYIEMPTKNEVVALLK